MLTTESSEDPDVPADPAEVEAASEPDETGSTAEPEPDVPRGGAAAVLRRVVTSQTLAAALIPMVVAGANAWWIWNKRHLGGFDPDESSYLSAALRIQRSIDFSHPIEVIRTILNTGNGITVPILSVPLLILGPRDPRMAMMIQPLLLVFIGIAVAGITRRLAGQRAAVAAAAFVVILPTVTTAVQSYWYGLGASAFFVGAIWALVASDRGANRNVWWFGVAAGLMVLTRTMTLGYFPACAIAGLVMAWPDKARLRRVIAALGAGVAVAAPWYIANRSSIFDYLFMYGYGPRAELFGKSGLGDRLSLRWERFVNGLGWGTEDGFGWVTNAQLALVLAVVALVYFAIRTARGRGADGTQVRTWAALVGALAAGMIALLSTSNNGVWFELPLVVLAVPIIVAPVARVRWQASIPIAIVAVGALTLNLWGALWLRPWKPTLPVSHYEWGFSEYDERFVPMRRDEHATAAADWWRLSRDIERSLECISPDGTRAVFTITGNTHLFNAGVIRMAAELNGWAGDLEIPDTTAPPEDRAGDLTPTETSLAGETGERVLVVGVHDQILWPADSEVGSFLQQARAAGFEETRRFPMPRGGNVLILRDADRSNRVEAGTDGNDCPASPPG